MARVSPVSMNLTYMPLPSAYARYFPFGEIAPLVTRFSKELTVSCRGLRSGSEGADDGSRLTNQKLVLVARKIRIAPAATIHVRSGDLSRSLFKVSNSMRISAA